MSADDDWTFDSWVAKFEDEDPEARRFLFRQLVEVDAAAAVWSLSGNGNPRTSTEVVRRVQDLHVRHEAEALFREAQREDEPDPPDLVRLTDLLAEPDDPVRYRVDGLWPKDGRVVLAAQNKTGKTTLTGNLVRALADGLPFLDYFAVEPADRVVVLDDEMSRSQTRTWLRDQGVINTDAVEVVNLRGRLSTFDLLDPAIRGEWAERLGSADVLVFDCLRPALDSLGLSEDKDAGRFLVALDELCREAGIADLLVVHHMGHSNERSRGDSRIEDWPDAKWKLLKEDPDDPASPRYFSAFGRDVDQAEVRLAYDEPTRHLSVNGPSRAEATRGHMDDALLLFLADSPGASRNALREAVPGDNKAKDEAIRRLRSGGLVVVRPGPNRSHLHYLADDVPDDEG